MRCLLTAHDTQESGPVPPQGPSLRQKSRSPQLFCKRLEGISETKLERNHIVFIDGIDIRPSDIEFKEYIECIKGLSQACWELNTEHFANIRDSKGRIKIVLLLRPDIFAKLDFQNANAKVQDNGVVLDWITTYSEYRNSRIFQMVDGIMGKQQQALYQPGEAWDYYFPYDLPNLFTAESVDNPFIGFLRYSQYRPRDIISYLLIMQRYVKDHQSKKEHFTSLAFHNCESAYSNYMLGEIKDYLSFYYSEIDFDGLIAFFNFVNGKNRLSYAEFSSAYDKYLAWARNRNSEIREVVSGPEEFLQFLYSMNIMGYVERTDTGSTFTHWCFRDRTPFLLNPAVRLGENYNVHPGLARALRVGGYGRRGR